MEKLKNDQVSQEQPVHDEERPIHLMDLYYRLMVPVLQQEVKSLNQTIDIYRGFNWSVVGTEKQQREALNEMKYKLDAALVDNQRLQRENNNFRCKASLAEQFLKGDDNVDQLADALYSGNILEFFSGPKKTEPITIPNLNDLAVQK